MINEDDVGDSIDFKDRKTGLLLFGVLEILIGVFCAFLAPLMAIVMFKAMNVGSVSVSSSANMNMMIPSILVYVLLAVWFIWIGIGSMKARRWARALLLVTSWLWLVSGSVGFLVALLSLPQMYDQMGANGLMSMSMVSIVKFVVMGLLLVLYVMMPAALVWFYGSKNVKATCEHYDKQTRWTDGCPLPVLAVSLTAGVWAIGMPCMGFYGWTIPVFGTLISGPAGMVCALLVMLLFGYTAWGTYRLSIKAWWCAVVLIAVWGASVCLTFASTGLFELYERMGYTEEQLELMQQTSAMQLSSIVLLTGVWAVIALGYLLYVRKYFEKSASKLEDEGSETSGSKRF